MKNAIKWFLLIVVGLFLMGYVADEQAALESAWGKPVRQNQGWRW